MNRQLLRQITSTWNGGVLNAYLMQQINNLETQECKDLLLLNIIYPCILAQLIPENVISTLKNQFKSNKIKVILIKSYYLRIFYVHISLDFHLINN